MTTLRHDLALRKPGEAVTGILSRLENVRRSGDGWSARCPAHEDRENSLSVAEGSDGRVLLHCFAGCPLEAIAAALGLTTRDLFPDDGARPDDDGLTLEQYAAMKKLPVEFLKGLGLVTQGRDGKPPCVAIPYRDEKGRTVRLRFRSRSRGCPKFWWSPGERLVPYGLDRLAASKPRVIMVEGESDCQTLWLHRIPALGVPGASAWRAEWARYVEGRTVWVWREPGSAGQHFVRRICHDIPSALVIDPPSEALKDPSALYLDNPDTVKASMVELARSANPLDRAERLAEPCADHVHPGANPWAQAKPAPEFLAEPDEAIDYLEERLLVPGCLSEMFSPRGLGKTHIAHDLAMKLTRRGLRVLLLDRDNSKREIRRRLRAWGASDVPNLKVLTRDETPPLTAAALWRDFPADDYDLIVLDSLESSNEGVGEQDSGKPSLALATILNIVRRENGPAFLVLGNTVKSGAHSRGCGVTEDRADIVYEVRDATGLRPTGKKPWWEELPPASADRWAERATRRKKRAVYRLALVPSKFRVGEEPEPFVFEIDLTAEPWAVRDVTAELERAGQEALEAEERAQREKLAVAAAALAQAVRDSGSTPMKKGEAVEFLRERELTEREAREVVQTGTSWRLEIRKNLRGHPHVLLPVAPGAEGSQKPPSEKTAPETPSGSMASEEGLPTPLRHKGVEKGGPGALAAQGTPRSTSSDTPESDTPSIGTIHEVSA